MVTVNDEFGLVNEQWGPPLMRMLVVDTEKIPDYDYYRRLVLDDVLEDEELQAAYRTHKPFANGAKIQRVSVPHHKPFGRALGGENEDGLVPGRLSSGDYKDDDDYEHIPAETIITGAPVGRYQHGAEIKELLPTVAWVWPDHLDGDEEPGVIRVLDGHGQPLSPRSDLTSCLVHAAKHPPPDTLGHPLSYKLRECSIEIDGLVVPVFIHPDDVVVDSMFTKLFRTGMDRLARFSSS